MNSRLQQAIDNLDVDSIQSTLSTMLTTNPTDSTGSLKQALRKIETEGIDVWEGHDGRELMSEKTEWTKEYFATLQSQLITNFSKERFERAIEVARYAYREELNRPKPRTSQSINMHSPRQNGNNTGNFLIAGAAIVALAVVVYLVAK